MPTICVFYGITIRLYFEDQPPPHSHATLLLAHSHRDPSTPIIPRTLLGANSLVYAWMARHKDELLRCWALAQDGLNPGKVAPLE